MTRQRRSIVYALLVLAAGSAGAFPRAQGRDTGLQMSAGARRQIEALMHEKATRSPGRRKMASRLIYGIKMHRGEKIADGVESLDIQLPRNERGEVTIDITADVSPDLLRRLRQAGATILGAYPRYNSVRADVTLDAVDAIADFPDVRFVQPMQEAITTRQELTRDPQSPVDPEHVRTTRPGFEERESTVTAGLAIALDEFQANSYNVGVSGVRKSEADITHRALMARNTYGSDGTGVKIGVLSDGVRNLAAVQASADLGPVTVLPGQSGTSPGQCSATASCDEGTAMLEIVHDIAPGAQLFFATAFGGSANFAQNIRALRAAGCDIIVDDVFYFAESPFQDGQAPGLISPTNGGIIIQAVNDVTAAGALYFSSAGNSGNKNDGTSGVWEGDFLDGGDASGPLAGDGRVHLFPGGNPFDTVTAVGSSQYNLNWSDPLGGSGNDYDLYALDAAGTSVIAASTGVQSGTQDPFEAIGAVAANSRLVIVKFSGAPRYLRLTTNRGRLSVSTAGQTTGHSTAASAFGVAAVRAVPVATVPPSAFTATNQVETFSSDGPRKLFFKADGTPFTPGNVLASGGILRQKPDISAADGVSVTGAGGFGISFFGTSAAAPHAAAIAALLKGANPALTTAMVRDALQNTAIDNEGPGVDRDSGYGIVMADTALQSIGAVPFAANVTIGAYTVTDVGGNANGFLEPGERGTITVPLFNTGDGDAANVTGTISSSSPRVAITPSAARNYGALAATSGSAARTFEFVLNESAVYAANVSFVLTVTYNGVTRSFPLTLPTGQLASISSILDTAAPIVPAGASYTATTGLQVSRMNFTFPISGCASVKTTPSVAASILERRYDAYSFTNTSASPICVTVNLTHSANALLYVDAYIPTFVATAVSTNFAGDNGGSTTFGAGTTQLFSFTVPAASTFAIVVSESGQDGGLNVPYNLRVTGLPGTPVPANLAPVNSVPAVQAVLEDGTLVFSAATSNPLSVSDADAGNNPIDVTLTATGGVLSLGTTAGLVFTAGDGSADAIIAVTGSIGDINNALNGLSYAPAAEFNGAASLTVSTSDRGNTGTGGAQTDSAAVTIVVAAVNDAPSFIAGGSQTVAEDSGPRTVAAWATSVSAGPANESGQTLSFVVTNDNNPLFSVQPAVLPDGTLTFTSAANANGSALVTVIVKDNGGTANGGVDASAPQTFTITVGAVNDAPVLGVIGPKTVYLGGTLTFAATATDIDLPAQTLSYSLFGNVPAGAAIGSANGVFTWVPTLPQVGGVYSFGVRVTDGLGGADEEQITVAVAYTTSGLLPPINDRFVENAGRTIPVKFNLTGASAAASNGVFRLFIAPVINGTAGPEALYGTFNRDGAACHVNWSTKGYPRGVYRLRIDLGDGVLRTVLITLV